MASPGVRMASDYNRGLAWPVRLVHIVLAGIADWFGPLWGWLFGTARRRWTVPLALAPLAFVLVYPFDAVLHAAAQWIAGWVLSGDIRRELEAWQQFGAVGSVLCVSALVFLLDRPRARKLLDLYAASLIGLAVYSVLKMGIGRPRPKFEDPWTILGPWGAYPLGPEKGVRHAWEAGAELWSVPSSHTVAAVILGWFLIRMYPAIWPLAVAAVGLVGSARIIFNAHWPSDVVAGAFLGFGIARAAIDGWWGVRGLDWLWRKTVNPLAEPAYPRLAAAMGEEAEPSPRTRTDRQPIQG